MFNVIINDVYIMGFRIMNGFILPPSSMNKVSGKYYPVILFTKQLAEKLYDKIEEQDWEIELRDKEQAVNDLLITAGYFGVYYA